MIQFDFQKHCYSCGLCESVCPTGAIVMQPDVDGFLVPKVSEEKCIHCGKCDNACIHLNVKEPEANVYGATAYAAYNLDEQTRLSSSSGGLFKLLADLFIENGDFVCGCVLNEDMMATHIVSNCSDDIKRMMGSKYVQSDIRGCYLKIKSILNNGNKVLFSGTPCQARSMLQYIGNNPNFYTMTVICHGVTSPMMWKKHIDEIEAKHGRISDFKFRDKTIGWRDTCNQVQLISNKAILKILSVDAFYQKAFIKSLLVKERCLSCVYKGKNIETDMILGDFWGLPSHYSAMDDDKGLSCVLTLTSKGNLIYNAISNKIKSVKVDRDIIFHGNARLMTPTSAHPKRGEFFGDVLMEKDSLSNLLFQYIGPQNHTERAKYLFKLALKRLRLYKTYYNYRMGKRKRKVKTDISA